MVATIQLYDLELLGLPKTVFSCNTLKTRIALNLKGLPFETKWLDFATVKEVIPTLTKQNPELKRPTVPVIVDSISGQDKVIQDSYDIAVYLEKQYPNTPSLFHNNPGVHRFFQQYCESVLLLPLFKLVMFIIHKQCGPDVLQDWWREDRERMFGCSLDVFAGNRDDNILAVKNALLPIIKVLKEFPFMTGEQVGWADVVLAADFKMMAALDPVTFESVFLSGFETPADDVLIQNWWKRMSVYI
ncbi:Beta-etherase [Choanephora cucurbitarum]|uniref:Beta-etherase n=1 Tax=Choanephora cucurbitarum TaxID=101091 RepID=A0A1C7NA83_9FUNG|nr:Beta-etherase [Choanephora cucurbitarum]